MDAEKIVQDRAALLNLLEKYPVLITTSHWFKGKDGQQYDGAWGYARLISATSLLGFEPAQSTNWLMVFDGGPDTLIIGGCQINYIQICPAEPVGNNVLKIYPKKNDNA